MRENKFILREVTATMTVVSNSSVGVGFLVLVAYEGELPPTRPTAHFDGFLGVSDWTGIGECETSIRLVHYQDQASANANLRERIESTDAPPATLEIPPTVNHIVIEKQHGRTLEAEAVGTYLSAIHVVAAPGYGADTSREIEETLESFELLEGYAGHVRGFNVALPDEVWALVFWSTPPVFPYPPEAAGANLEHYRRVG